MEVDVYHTHTHTHTLYSIMQELSVGVLWFNCILTLYTRLQDNNTLINTGILCHIDGQSSIVGIIAS